MVSTTLVMQPVKAGRLKAVAVIEPKRLTEQPQVDAMAEQGASETAAALVTEHERLGKLIQQLGIKADGAT